MEGPSSLSKDPSPRQHSFLPTVQPKPSLANLQPREQSSEQSCIPSIGHQLFGFRKSFCAPYQKTLSFPLSARRPFPLASCLETPGLQSVDTYQTPGDQWRGHFSSTIPEPGSGSQQTLLQSSPQCLLSVCSRWCCWWQEPTIFQSGSVSRIASKCTVGDRRDFAALPSATPFLSVACQILAIPPELHHFHTRATSAPAQPPSQPLTAL